MTGSVLASTRSPSLMAAPGRVCPPSLAGPVYSTPPPCCEGRAEVFVITRGVHVQDSMPEAKRAAITA